MTTDPDELQMLSRARKLLSPTPSDAERVWQATHAQIVAQPLPAGTTEQAALGPKLASSLSDKWLAGCAIALVSGAIGFYAGFDLGRRESEKATRAQLGQPAKVLPAPAAPTTPVPPVSLQPPRAQGVIPTATGAEQPGSARPIKRPHAGVVPESQPSASPVAVALTLAQEVEILKRVERALREGEPGTALELLDDLERRGASAMLAEERLAATIMARCGLGLGISEQLLAQLKRQYPNSMYQARVEHACAMPTE